MVIVFITITLKYFMLLIHQAFIQNMIKYIERDYSEDNNYSEEDKETILKYVKKGGNVCIFWLCAGFGTCVTFPLKAFASMFYLYWKGEFRLVPMFEITFPEPIESYKNSIAVFWIWFAMTFLFDLYATTMNVGFDPIIPICMLHVCGQTALLSRRLTRIFAEIEDPKEIQAQLRFIIIKVQSLYDFIGGIKSSFGLLFEVNMKSTTFTLPLIAFQIVESEIFRQEIYASGWQKCSDVSVRHTILLMLTRARVPMGVRSVFYEMSLDTFAEVIVMKDVPPRLRHLQFDECGMGVVDEL
ncbi:unnamed protein product [Arctia plantaginis]|uniref:Uncharacterized protein n=1 Tax=Arctia plantaginis TaxID=874455 RepID=A0A8S0ZVP8_ARCPL|nr:unnamed protein product [Arctia plantaginis]